MIKAAMDPSSGEFFERKYRKSADPWKFGSSEYELGRYAATMRAIEGRRYVRAFEPGCSIGVLTERLAAVCDRVEAMEISPTAAHAAQARCAGRAHVRVTCGSLANGAPAGKFDLVVLSEIGYYLKEDALAACGRELAAALLPEGVLLAVHWLGHSKDHRLSGDAVHTILAGLPGLRHELEERHAGFRLDRWTKQ